LRLPADPPSGSRREKSLEGSLDRLAGRLARIPTPRFIAIWVATGLMFALSPLLVSGSVRVSALQAMLPYAAILAVAEIGQTLVIQQRGLDLSVPGMITRGIKSATLKADPLEAQAQAV
jgi:hypothetical protein